MLRLPGQGNRELIAISAASKGYRKLHFEVESRIFNTVGYSAFLWIDEPSCYNNLLEISFRSTYCCLLENQRVLSHAEPERRQFQAAADEPVHVSYRRWQLPYGGLAAS